MAPSLSTALVFFKTVMQQDSREAVVRDALEYYKRASPTVLQQLEKAIQAHVKVKGFRALRAPLPALLHEVMAASYRSDVLLEAVLHVWIERHADLRESVRDFLRTRGMFATGAVDSGEGATASLTSTEICEAATVFQTQYANFDRDNVALMLYCFAERALLLAEDEPPKKEGATMKWEQWLAELRTLPADAPEWKTMNEFVVSVQRLGEEKRREHEASREQLRRALAAVRDQAVADLEYFALDVTAWTAEACPLAEVIALAEQVMQLHEALSAHRLLRQQHSVTLTEHRNQRNKLDRLEELVFQAHARLSTALAVSPPESPPPQTPPPETPLPQVEEATSKEEGTSQKEGQEDMIPRTSALSSSSEPTRVETGGMPALKPTTAMPPPEVPLPHMEEGPSIEAGQEETISLDASSSSVSESTRVETHGALAAPEPTAEIPPDDSTGVPTRERALAEEENTTLSEKREVQDEPIVPQELRSSQEVAALLQTDDREQLWHALLWALIAEDDVPAAYWLTLSLVASGHAAPVPDWLLAAVQGARWLGPDSETFVSNLLDITKTSRPNSDNVHVLLGLAAALRPALIAPVSGMLGWLSSPSWCPALHGLVTAVSTFASTGIALRPEDLLGVAGAEQREAALTEAAHAVRRWLDEALGQRLKLKRASDVWRSLVGSGGELRELLLPVGEDHRSEVEQVRECLDQWQQPDYISSRIQQLRPPVGWKEGTANCRGLHRQLVRDVEAACSLVRRWCDLVDHEHQIEARGSWLFEQVSQLRSQCAKSTA